MADPALYADAQRAAEVQRSYQRAKDELAALYEAWEQAEAQLSEQDA